MSTIKFHEAICNATAQCMEECPEVYIIGLGVPDPTNIFGTTKGLLEKFGPQRVMDMPCAENGMTGIALGAAINGLRPILTHQRVDFALLSIEQIVNQMAKWHYMFGGQVSVPLVIRMIIGKGWGQGPQHSQSLHSWFSHIPGLKVVLPSTPYIAKGTLISAIRDNNPVLFLEHRWLHNISGDVPNNMYEVPLDKSVTLKEGKDLTIVSVSHMTIETLKAERILSSEGINVEVIDLVSVNPIDRVSILKSVSKTKRLLIADIGHLTTGISAELIAMCAENKSINFKCKPARIGLPEAPTPTSPKLASHYYPRHIHIISKVKEMLDLPYEDIDTMPQPSEELDKPDAEFTGPF